MGLGLVEYALTRVTFMPFATEYLPGRSNLRARWPIHVAVLLFVVPSVAEIERKLVVACQAFRSSWRRRSASRWARLIADAPAPAGHRIVLTADPGTGADWTPVQLRIGYAAPSIDAKLVTRSS